MCWLFWTGFLDRLFVTLSDLSVSYDLETFGFRYDAANNEIEALSGNCASAGQAISDNSQVLITDLRFVVNFTDEEIENTHIEPLPKAGGTGHTATRIGSSPRTA